MMLKSKVLDVLTKIFLIGVFIFVGNLAYNYYNGWVIKQYESNITSVREAVDSLADAGQRLNTISISEFGHIKTTGSIGMGSASMSVGFSTGPSLKVNYLKNSRMLVLSFYNMQLTKNNCYPIMSVISENFDGEFYIKFDGKKSVRENKRASMTVDDICNDGTQEFQTTLKIKKRRK